ncbi:MAG: DUF2141 domain-containing protein [Sphingomonadaceae bacterium]
MPRRRDKSVRIVILASSLLALTAASLPSANLDVAIAGLRSPKGNVLACLTANPKYFPNCSRDPRALKLAVPAAEARMIEFPNVAPGTYALALMHDENANQKLDVRLFVPKEGFAFSRNPIVRFAPPKFDAVAFTVGTGESVQRVTMRYML